MFSYIDINSFFPRSYLDIQHIEQLTEWRKKKIGGKINELSAICSSVLQNMAQIKTQANIYILLRHIKQ